MGCGASAEARIHQKTASRRTHNGASKVGRVQVLVDMNFDDIRQCLADDSDDSESTWTSPAWPRKSESAPPVLMKMALEKLSPRSWTYDDPHVPEGMEIAAAPNRMMHEEHVQKVNLFLQELEENPDSLSEAVGIRRRVDEYRLRIMSGEDAPEKDPVALSRVEDLEEVQELPEAVETKTAESKKTKPAKAKAPLKAQVDPSMPFTELEPFGREATGQELTEASIRESDAMIDQIEKAEIAEEERSVFRALTRLRGAALASFDGIARAHQHNIQEYALENQYRKVHPVQHLAEEEADVSRWAFPSNAD
ncbi:Hypothetical protein SCF082_LOCUS45766 [Durusdinium trenchii]|uniref:Uncharacterized protein n=1 Tax=Durusdinium trenchii TaxID=1381693 RepID=A0ABP0RAE8_9DINO